VSFSSWLNRRRYTKDVFAENARNTGSGSSAVRLKKQHSTPGTVGSHSNYKCISFQVKAKAYLKRLSWWITLSQLESIHIFHHCVQK